MPARNQAVIRMQPHMIPALRVSFGEAIAELKLALAGVRRSGYLPEPWLGDEASSDVAAFYTQRAMDGPHSSYKALVAYSEELERVHNTLQHMEDTYRRNEGDIAGRLGRA